MTLDNESALEELAWAIEASQGQFSLFLARCNYTNLQRQLSQQLQPICAVPIRTLELKREDKTLYARIQAELGSEQPNGVMVFGLEMVEDLEHLLTSTNQVREEFQKNFQFPLVLWVNDKILTQLTRIAPDFESWATTVAFLMLPQNLANLFRETAEQWFTNNLAFTLEDCLALEVELEAAQKDLRDYEQIGSQELEAERQSLLGFVKRVNQQVDVAIEHYQTGLAFWRSTQNLERQAKLLDEIAFCYYLKNPYYQNRNQTVSQETKDYVREYLQVIEQIQRPDLLANSILRFGEALNYVQDWEQFQRLVRQALAQHETDNKLVELGRDYGFLAYAALAQSRWDDANQLARKALEILSIFETGESTNLIKQNDASFYRFILAKAQQSLGQFAEAIQNLEAAKEVGSPDYDPQLFIDILCHLQGLYFDVKDYLNAFQIKLERKSVEQRYGLRAFIGAGRIKSQRQAKLALKQVVQTHLLDSLQENIAPEITASGRMLDVERLRQRVGDNNYKLIVIHGQSGVGKSSLVYGGLVPALKQKAIGFQDVLPVTMRVYTNWVEELGRLLLEALAQKGVETFYKTSLQAEKETFHATSLQNTADILAQLKQNESHNLRTVLIFDQFEEFFFVYPNPVERRDFFAFLGECLNILPLKVILSLREDYLHYLLEMDSLDSMKIISNDILAKNVRYKLGNFSTDDAKSIIERLTEASSFKLDSDLIGQLVEDLARELGEVRPIELQVVGSQLQTENITTLAQYQSFGRKATEELVKRYLAQVVNDCGEGNKQVAELVLFLLTDEKGTRPLKTRAELERDLQALVADLSAEGRVLDLVLDIFVGSGLVLLLPEKPFDRYQLVHDYLAAFINQQQRPKLNELIAELEKERQQRQQAEAKRQVAEEQLQQSEEGKKILQAANHKAKQLIQRGSAFFVISVIVAAVTGISAVKVYLDFREAQEATRLEREALGSLRKFEYREMEALVSAIRTGQDLKSLVKNRPLEEYPTASPLLALETILDNIREESQLKGHQSPVNSANFSPKGDRIVTASDDKTARVWDLSGKLIAELKGHQGYVWSANF
ncbi:hypothetical protein LAY41_28870, partial [Argonema galeatum A003/A1]|nr:hypothetical protein [Argonema galeatum A003/A1]